jgi:hypothetical protein
MLAIMFDFHSIAVVVKLFLVNDISNLNQKMFIN